ncbi:MAG TPA: radical SAM protein, partial [Aggregatilinea sp.]|uniref:radical SAM protein n=1 Tax=Aggregatilinea sp. TaxID=2806333 RepID=UPI002B859763
TGGEPLLHKPQAVHFFEHALERFPGVHTRLYTCGDYVDEAILAELRDAGLREIRFSIRMHDTDHLRKRILERVELAKRYIPDVMIEMPIIPGTLDIMKDILRELDRIGIYSINLLELCYPLLNAAEFKARGFKVKKRPFDTLYDYWYAGGVPIAGSEAECLDLLEFAHDEGLKIGVHYCSLENKLTGQNYQQNASHPVPRTAVLSQNDYLLKSAKVFGDDIGPVMEVLEREHIREYAYDPDHNCLEFTVNAIRALKKLDIEVGISTSTFEERPDGMVIRELKVDLTTPRQFKRADV